MDGDIWIHFASAVLMVTALAIPIYLSFRLKSDLQKLTLFLSIFLFIHLLYHTAITQGFEFLGYKVFEPASIVMLTIFGVVYFRVRKKKVDIER